VLEGAARGLRLQLQRPLDKPVTQSLCATAAVLVLVNITFVDRPDSQIPDQTPSEFIPGP
jgi:hypothetical protein